MATIQDCILRKILQGLVNSILLEYLVQSYIRLCFMLVFQLCTVSDNHKFLLFPLH